jgi:hypothetical protein
LPATNFTVFAAAIWILAPVAGLRPTRAAWAPVENDPKPISRTVPPFVTEVIMAPMNASIASPVAALLSPLVAATASEASPRRIYRALL